VSLPVEICVPRDAEPGVRVCSDAWAECLRDRGFDVTSADVSDLSSEATAVIVAPHAALRPLQDESVRIASILNRAVCVTTSRFGSGGLEADKPFQSAAAASVALSRDAARHLTAHGISTAHLKLGGHPRLCSAQVEARTVSIGMHARSSSFREDIVASAREMLASYPCDLRISHTATAGLSGRLTPLAWMPWLTSIDVLISVPSESGPGTDWCEVAPAVMNGAVVLTTAESDFGPLSPGGDMATATVAGFADSLRRLLADDDRRARMRESARASLAASPLDVSPLAEAICSAQTYGRRVRPFAPLPSSPPVLCQ
jgi:hypothetical protein